MLHATEREIEHVTEYMRSQAPDLTVQLVQKVIRRMFTVSTMTCGTYIRMLTRWWVITEPMNLYSQEQFPNMDLASPSMSVCPFGFPAPTGETYSSFLLSLLLSVSGACRKFPTR